MRAQSGGFDGDPARGPLAIRLGALRLGALLFLCAPDGIPGQQAGWMASFRGAVPGIWTMGLAGSPAMGKDWGTPRGSLLAGPGGLECLKIEIALPLGSDMQWGGGLGWRRDKVGTALLAVSKEGMAARLSIPIVQPAAQPFVPSWWFGVAVAVEEIGKLRVTVEWTPGAWPRLALRASGPTIRAGAGSDGAWVGWTATDGLGPSTGLSLKLGILRGDIPWGGIDFGSATDVGSDPGQWILDQWLE